MYPLFTNAFNHSTSSEVSFVIVSSDKDYLPVMRIASYKKIKSRILGINTSDIYEKYNIDDIKFLGIMKFFD